jgi:hypothetical protein
MNFKHTILATKGQSNFAIASTLNGCTCYTLL